jgi:molybdopterin-binding protein
MLTCVEKGPSGFFFFNYSVITTGSIKKMGLKVGDDVSALVKATSVMVMK